MPLFNPSAGGGGTNTMGMSNIGNTSGTTGVVSASANQYYFAGGSNITLSQSLNGSSGTLTFIGNQPGAQNMSFWQNMGVNGSATDAMAQTGMTYNQLHIFQLDIGNNIFAGNMTVSSVFMNMTATVATSIPSYTISAYFGLYTVNQAGGSSLGLLNSGSVSFGTSLSGMSGSSTTTNHQGTLNGKRYIVMASSVFSTQVSMSQGLYYGAVLYRSSGVTGAASTASVSMSMYGAILGESGQRSGTFGQSGATQTYIGAMPFMGIYSATTTAFPATIQSGGIEKTSLNAIFIPHIMFNNIQSSF